MAWVERSIPVGQQTDGGDHADDDAGPARLPDAAPRIEPTRTIASDPKSLVVLIGPPRSGTTLIANTFMSHSAVSGVMEPYQRGRHEGFITTDLGRFIVESHVRTLAERPHLAVKETTTRAANIDLSLALMDSAAARIGRTGLVLILRCPFSAYLSQVEASQTLWKQKNRLPEVSEDTFRRWSRGLQTALRRIVAGIGSRPFVIVSYEAFCDRPGHQTARMMTLIDQAPEPDTQLSFRPPEALRGGDPNTRRKSGRIDMSDRSDQIGEILRDHGGLPEMAFMRALRDIAVHRAGRALDAATLRQLSELLDRHA